MSLKMKGEDENASIIEGNVSGQPFDTRSSGLRLSVVTGGDIIDVLVPRAAVEALRKAGVAEGWRIRALGKLGGRKRPEGFTNELRADQIVWEPPKKKYVVNRKEIHVQPIEVLAHSPEEARQMVVDGVGDDIGIGMEYHSTMDRKHWIVEEVDKEGKVLETFD